jgi:hypothetical protein
MKNWGRLRLKVMAALMLPGILVAGLPLAHAGAWAPDAPLVGILQPEDILGPLFRVRPGGSSGQA